MEIDKFVRDQVRRGLAQAGRRMAQAGDAGDGTDHTSDDVNIARAVNVGRAGRTTAVRSTQHVRIDQRGGRRP